MTSLSSRELAIIQKTAVLGRLLVRVYISLLSVIYLFILYRHPPTPMLHFISVSSNAYNDS